MHAPDPSCLSFDDVTIDFLGHRLTRAGSAQPLEPKAFAVLALLAQAPGRVFSRDEILDAVWGHRHVTPGVLNRVMTLLRHALGEDAHAPRYLHTVHGVGYRFDLPEETRVAADVQPPDPESTPTPEAVLAPAVPGGTRRRHARPRARQLAWILPLLALLGFAGWKGWPRDAPPASTPRAAASTAATTPTLVVVPLKAISTDSGTRILAEGLSEELICSLSRIEGLRLIAHDSTRRLDASPVDNRATALGITHALEGNLQQSGEQLRVRLRMMEAGTGRLLWTREFDRDASETLSLQRDIADAVANSLTLKLGLAVPDARGGDAGYQRRFMDARVLALRLDLPAEESIAKAVTTLRALALERPDDARTRAWLALALRIHGARQPELQPALAAEAVREARLALRLDPSRYEPYLVLGADDCRHARWESCMARLDHALALAPGLSYVHHDRATALASLGYLDQAELHARESLLRDPLNPGARYQLARVLDLRGKHEEALQLLQDGDARTLHARWFNAVSREDLASALRLAEAYAEAGRSHPATGRLGPSTLAVTRALMDATLWPQARAELQRYEREHPGQANLAGVFAPDTGAAADALVARLLAARGRDPAGVDLLWTRGLAHLRQTPAFQRHLRESGILAYWQKHGFPTQCRPRGRGADCD